MKNRKSFFAGMLTMALLFSLLVSASAVYANVTKTLSYQDIKVTLNGERLDLRDANGKAVDPFIIDGTTYLPVRAVSESLGLDVEWNKNEKTVVLSGDVSDASGDKKLLGYYTCIKTASDKLEDIYLDFNLSKLSLYTDTSPVSDTGESFPAVVQLQLKDYAEIIEQRYAQCKSAGIADESDFEMLIEFRRLNSKAIDILGDFAAGKGSDPLLISSVTASSMQNCLDSAYLMGDANQAFWELCDK